MKPLLLTVALLMTEIPLPAQEKEPAFVGVSLFTFDYAEGHRKIYLTTDKGTPEEIALSTANVLGPFKTRLTDEGLLAIRERIVSEKGEELYPVIVGVKIPKSVKQPLVILFPSSGEEPYHSLVIDGDTTKFPEGSYRLINFSENDIRALVGKTRVTVAAHKITIFNPSSNQEELMDVHFQYRNGEDWRTFGRTRWVNDGKGRTLLCAFADPLGRRVKIRGIPLR